MIMPERALDLICPIYHVDWNFFSSNVESWLRELPINKMIFGIATKDLIESEVICDYLNGKYKDKIMIIDQRDKKTLGYCLSQLIDSVNTKWFVYVHSDVELTEFCFDIIKNKMQNGVGIIESERIHYDGMKYSYDPYYFSKRAYSGFQIMKKEIVDLEFDDDYVYRNEDMIFQNYCENQGYGYRKVFAIHIHQITTTKNWTHSREETYDMQWKGLVKYTTPTEITIQAAVDALNVCIHEFNHDILKIIEIIQDDEWKKAILTRLIKK